MVKIDLSTLKAEQTKSFSNCILDREEMDYNKYYDQQTKGLTGYHGAVFQNGSGLGSMFTVVSLANAYYSTSSSASDQYS